MIQRRFDGTNGARSTVWNIYSPHSLILVENTHKWSFSRIFIFDYENRDSKIMLKTDHKLIPFLQVHINSDGSHISWCVDENENIGHKSEFYNSRILLNYLYKEAPYFMVQSNIKFQRIFGSPKSDILNFMKSLGKKNLNLSLCFFKPDIIA